MRDHDAAIGDLSGTCGAGVLLAVRGHVVDAPRRLRTAEGWQVVSLLLGPTRAVGARGHAAGPPAVGLPVVCTGDGASDALAHLGAGHEVVVVGRPVPRRASHPADDSVELEALALLARPDAVAAAAMATDPRIAS